MVNDKCVICGRELSPRSYKYCERCLRKAEMSRSPYHDAPKKKKTQPEESIDDIVIKAAKHGMSYGKYLAARYAGLIDD